VNEAIFMHRYLNNILPLFMEPRRGREIRAVRLLGDERSRLIFAAAAIAVSALAIRLVNIEWSFSNNGIDEGIMLERSLLIGRGFSLYSEIPCDQAPFWLLTGSLLEGDVLNSRLMNSLLSMLAILACMWSARRIGGDISMLICGLLLAVDFALVRESRLFSLDAASSFFLAFSLPFLVSYAKNGDRLLLLMGSAMIGLSAASKLHGGVAVFGLLMFILLEGKRAGRGLRASSPDMCASVLGAVLPIVAMMLLLGPQEMLDGMIFDQAGREFEPFLKLSILAFFGTNLAYLLPLILIRRMWSAGPENRLILLVSLMMTAYLVLQPLLFYHHMVMLSPFLAVLAGSLVSMARAEMSSSDREKPEKLRGQRISPRTLMTVVLAGVIISSGFVGYGLVAQQETAQSYISKRLADLADEGDYVISGDPIIAAYAGLPVPPDVVNVAFRMYPDLTLETIEKALGEYPVVAVVVCYRLNELGGLTELLESEDFVQISSEYFMGGEAGVLDLFQDGIDPVSLFVQRETAEELELPLAS